MFEEFYGSCRQTLENRILLENYHLSGHSGRSVPPEPLGELGRNVARAIVGQQPWPSGDGSCFDNPIERED